MNSLEASLSATVSTPTPRSKGMSALTPFWIGPGFIVGTIAHSFVFLGPSTTFSSTIGAPLNAAAVFATVALTSAALSLFYYAARKKLLGPLNFSVLTCVASGTLASFICLVSLDALRNAAVWEPLNTTGLARFVTLIGITLVVSAMSVESSGRVERILNRTRHVG